MFKNPNYPTIFILYSINQSIEMSGKLQNISIRRFLVFHHIWTPEAVPTTSTHIFGNNWGMVAVLPIILKRAWQCAFCLTKSKAELRKKCQRNSFKDSFRCKNTYLPFLEAHQTNSRPFQRLLTSTTYQNMYDFFYFFLRFNNLDFDISNDVGKVD